MASKFGRDLRIGFDDENGGPVIRLSGSNRALKLSNRGNLHRNRTEARGMSHEIDSRQRLAAGVLQQIVEACTPGGRLQAIYAAEAGIVEYDNSELEAEHDRGRDLGVHHQIGTVADH